MNSHNISIKFYHQGHRKTSNHIDSATVNHTVIRGLDTKKLMVRRQLYNLYAWIIAFIILTKSRLSVRTHNAIKWIVLDS